MAKPRPEDGKPVELRGSVLKRRQRHAVVVGDGMVRKATRVNQGDLFGKSRCSWTEQTRRAGASRSQSAHSSDEAA